MEPAVRLTRTIVLSTALRVATHTLSAPTATASGSAWSCSSRVNPMPGSLRVSTPEPSLELDPRALVVRGERVPVDGGKPPMATIRPTVFVSASMARTVRSAQL